MEAALRAKLGHVQPEVRDRIARLTPTELDTEFRRQAGIDPRMVYVQDHQRQRCPVNFELMTVQAGHSHMRLHRSTEVAAAKQQRDIMNKMPSSLQKSPPAKKRDATLEQASAPRTATPAQQAALGAASRIVGSTRQLAELVREPVVLLNLYRLSQQDKMRGIGAINSALVGMQTIVMAKGAELMSSGLPFFLTHDGVTVNGKHVVATCVHGPGVGVYPMCLGVIEAGSKSAEMA